MDKFTETAEKRLRGQDYILHAKEALVRAEFASREREAFLNTAYGELLVDYFLEFCNSEPQETKKREFIYSCVLGLGDVKGKLVQYETYGRNIKVMDGENNGPAPDSL